MTDWIAPVEAAYQLEGGLDDWFGRIIDSSNPLLDGLGSMGGFILAGPPSAYQVAAFASRGVHSKYFPVLERLIRSGGPQALSQAFGRGYPLFSSLSERLLDRDPEQAARFRQAFGDSMADCLYFVAPTASGAVLALGSALAERRKTTRAERSRWTRLAAHIGAGLRLRRSLEAAPTTPQPEAILDGSGRLHDATGLAVDSRAREVLRTAVKNRDRARTQKQRRDPEMALSLWEGLVAGRWSLVDRFESDGKRFVVAIPNDPDVGDPRGLSRRERQVAEYLGMGRSLKEISYLLGVGPADISNSATRAATKLGLHGRTELAVFFAPNGLRAQLSEAEVAGERLAIGSARLLAGLEDVKLSGAELDVALDLLRGSTTAEIATRRGRSPRTVETQCKAIFVKVGVHSRGELVSKLGGSS